MGSMGGLLVAPLLLSHLGITGPFLAFGLAGLVWAAGWVAYVSSTPAECARMDAAELKYIRDGQPPAKVTAEVGVGGGVGVPPFRLLFSKMPTWALVVASMVNNWVRGAGGLGG